ncbi:MAG: acetate--CoA ligase [Deltaproteobacteria bacterium]|nr:acetate--CoA ligase [Deltaproteobacteria bacterium]MCB9490363.1 acetate--CoA ligase [Deltaproteobacteria bacterium]
MSDAKSIDSVSHENRHFPVPDAFRAKAHISSLEQYEQMHKRSLEDPEGFWGEIADGFWWKEKWSKVVEYDFSKPEIKWFVGGKTNITVNCLDRHLDTRGDQVALHFEGNEPGDARDITYRELHADVCKAANALKSLGVKKGDRIAIYMPMIPELAVAVLACARIGAIHSVVFGGFSADSLADRILDSKCAVVLTADGVYRGKKHLALKETVDEAVARCNNEGFHVEHVVVVRNKGPEAVYNEGIDKSWQELVGAQSAECEPEIMDAEDPLFILYTSGSTGKPKGVLHTVGGYMIYTATTFKYVFDYHDGDIFWCTADIGWVTGHSYIVYGPMANGATQVMFEGIPTYPGPDRFWEICAKYKVNIFYTAPTAIRAIAALGAEHVKKHDLSSLQLLGTVGEPINPEAWMWYYDTVGGGRCPIVDTWWQTETGGILITPLPGAMETIPSSAQRPFFGVQPAVVREDGSECGPNEGGYLIIRKPWPSIMRTVYGDHQRFHDTYFSQQPGNYFTGDGARYDEDGNFWLMGRIDDVVNVSGHRLGTAEVESSLVAHPAVAEAAVVGFPHEIKGQGIYAYVTLNKGVEKTEDLKKELLAHVRKDIGAIAVPERIHWADALPKTRSGKIMRRILKKIASGDHQIGDTTTLADPGVVDSLFDDAE